ncbi:MAG: alpha/beta hydrolase, partial [Burkholderiales bacterium]|nr:alpha/beta hydrolase [Burkholderiales bacterium]
MQPTTLTPVNIALEIGRLDGVLATPNKAIGIVVFAQRIGGSRSAAHNNPVAAALQKKGIATLLFDLVTPVEDSRHGNRFNVDLLAARLQLATEWIWKLAGFADCPVGYFGIDIGGAAALRAAAHLGKRIRAVVSQGDRPDLA